MTDQTVLMTQFLNALATRAEATKSAVVAIRPANGRQAVSRQYKALIMPRAASGAKRPFMRQVATTKLAVDRQIEHG
jgi:hypothetical protein